MARWAELSGWKFWILMRNSFRNLWFQALKVVVKKCWRCQKKNRRKSLHVDIICFKAIVMSDDLISLKIICLFYLLRADLMIRKVIKRLIRIGENKILILSKRLKKVFRRLIFNQGISKTRISWHLQGFLPNLVSYERYSFCLCCSLFRRSANLLLNDWKLFCLFCIITFHYVLQSEL